MATILQKRSGTNGASPSTGSLSMGELAVNHYNGRLFTKMNSGGGDIIVEFASLTGTQTLSGKTLTTPTISGAMNLDGAYIVGEAANALALRNGGNRQNLRLYDTYTDGSNYSRWVFDLSTGSGNMQIKHTAIGSEAGTIRDLELRPTSNIVAYAGLLWGADNTYDLGSSGAFRPRDVHVGRDIYCSGVTWALRSILVGNSDEMMTIDRQNSGSVANYISFKRSGTMKGTFGIDTSGRPTINSNGDNIVHSISGTNRFEVSTTNFTMTGASSAILDLQAQSGSPAYLRTRAGGGTNQKISELINFNDGSFVGRNVNDAYNASDIYFYMMRQSGSHAVDYVDLRARSYYWGVGRGDYGIEWSGLGRRDQNALTRIGVANNTSGASAGAQIEWISGTTNSYVTDTIWDNAGSPYFERLMGSAISFVNQRAPIHVFSSQANAEFARIDSTGYNTANGTKIHAADSGTSPDRGYGYIGVTRAGTSGLKSYFSLVNAGRYAMAIGMDHSDGSVLIGQSNVAGGQAMDMNGVGVRIYQSGAMSVYGNVTAGGAVNVNTAGGSGNNDDIVFTDTGYTSGERHSLKWVGGGGALLGRFGMEYDGTNVDFVMRDMYAGGSGSAQLFRFTSYGRLTINPTSNGGDTIQVYNAAGTKLFVVKPETATGVTQVGYYIGSGGIGNWGTIYNPGSHKAARFEMASVTDLGSVSGTVTPDWTQNNYYRMTTSGNMTLAIGTAPPPGTYIVEVIYGGSHTLTVPAHNGSTIRWAGGAPPTSTNTSGKIDILQIVSDGTNVRMSMSVNY